MKHSLIAFATSLATVFVALVILEVVRRKTTDPVARIADVIAPPRSIVTVTADPSASAASAGVS